MKTGSSDKTNTLQQILDDDKQYHLSSVIADAKQDEAPGAEKFMDKSMKELLNLPRNHIRNN